MYYFIPISINTYSYNTYTYKLTIYIVKNTFIPTNKMYISYENKFNKF